jgi:hypothetical protein
MDFFKRNAGGIDKKEVTLVGAQVPSDVSEYLTLFCVADGKSKTSILRPLIEDWVKAAQDKLPEKKLIKLIADKGFAAWESRKNKRIPFTTVLNAQQKELKRRGIPEKTINKIIKKIEDAKNEKG